MRLIGTLIAGTVHLRNDKHRTVRIQRQLLQRRDVTANHLFLGIVLLTDTAQQMQIIEYHEITFALLTFQHHLRTDIRQRVTSLVINIQRQMLQLLSGLFEHLQFVRRHTGNTQMIRIDIRDAGQDTVQHLQVRHLETEETDMFTGPGSLYGNMQSHSCFPVARMARQYGQFPFMKSSGDIIKLAHPAQQAVPVMSTQQSFAMPFHHFGSQLTDRTYRLAGHQFLP